MADAHDTARRPTVATVVAAAARWLAELDLPGAGTALLRDTQQQVCHFRHRDRMSA